MSKQGGLEVLIYETKSEEEALAIMDKHMRDYTMRAARGEHGWVCSDCCMSYTDGMPDECFHGHQGCTDIIQRDKRNAMQEGNEPW
ncbi:MAG: hypothetical protein VYD45_11435 [Pseudomonadota bacterium]|nr:hypothetical protein [Pseudomonadota bacterium]